MSTQDPIASTPQANNLSDPLAQLKDIHLPAEIGLWPPAWGWWLLVLFIIGSTATILFLLRRHKSRNAYRATALKELDNLQRELNENQAADYLQGLSIILRRTAITGCGKHFNPSINGQEWLEWLDSCCHQTKQQFSQGIGTVLLHGRYQKSPEFDRSQLHRLCVMWIQTHRNQWQLKQQSSPTQERPTHV